MFRHFDEDVDPEGSVVAAADEPGSTTTEDKIILGASLAGATLGACLAGPLGAIVGLRVGGAVAVAGVESGVEVKVKAALEDMRLNAVTLRRTASLTPARLTAVIDHLNLMTERYTSPLRRRIIFSVSGSLVERRWRKNVVIICRVLKSGDPWEIISARRLTLAQFVFLHDQFLSQIAMDISYATEYDEDDENDDEPVAVSSGVMDEMGFEHVEIVASPKKRKESRRRSESNADVKRTADRTDESETMTTSGPDEEDGDAADYGAKSNGAYVEDSAESTGRADEASADTAEGMPHNTGAVSEQSSESTRASEKPEVLIGEPITMPDGAREGPCGTGDSAVKETITSNELSSESSRDPYRDIAQGESAESTRTTDEAPAASMLTLDALRLPVSKSFLRGDLPYDRPSPPSPPNTPATPRLFRREGGTRFDLSGVVFAGRETEEGGDGRQRGEDGAACAENVHDSASTSSASSPDDAFCKGSKDDVNHATDICCICMESPAVVVLPCYHSFCETCIDAWVATRRSTCPLCRGRLGRREERWEVLEQLPPDFDVKSDIGATMLHMAENCGKPFEVEA